MVRFTGIKNRFVGFLVVFDWLTCERARRGLGLAPYSIFWNLVRAPPLATYVFPDSKSAKSRTRVPPTGVYRFLTAPNGAFTPVVTWNRQNSVICLTVRLWLKGQYGLFRFLKTHGKCKGYNINTSADKINFSNALFNHHKCIYNTVTIFIIYCLNKKTGKISIFYTKAIRISGVSAYLEGCIFIRMHIFRFWFDAYKT